MRRLAVEGMGSLTFDADLVRQGKVEFVVDLAERFYFLRRSRFLISEIIRRHDKSVFRQRDQSDCRVVYCGV